MKYVIVENKQTILLGPMDWRVRMFQSELDDLEIDFQLSPSEPTQYQKITDEVEIYPVVAINVPNFDPIYEHLAGPFWSFDNNEAVGTYTVHTTDLLLIQNNLKNILASERYRRQNLGTTVDIGGQTISVGTDIDSLNKYVSLLNTVGSETINYKSNVGFISLGQSDLQSIVDTINSYIQTQFNWELETSQMIDNSGSVEELKAITITE